MYYRFIGAILNSNKANCSLIYKFSETVILQILLYYSLKFHLYWQQT